MVFFFFLPFSDTEENIKNRTFPAVRYHMITFNHNYNRNMLVYAIHCKCYLEYTESSPSVSIQTISKTYPGQRDYIKYHHCYFYGKTAMKMARYLEACHADEHEIASLPEKSKSSSDIRNKTFEIEQFWKFPSKYQCFNKKSGTLIIGKRASGNEAKDYLPCLFCLVFFLSSDLSRHTKTCKFQIFHQSCTPVRGESPQDHLH